MSKSSMPLPIILGVVAVICVVLIAFIVPLVVVRMKHNYFFQLRIKFNQNYLIVGGQKTSTKQITTTATFNKLAILSVSKRRAFLDNKTVLNGAVSTYNTNDIDTEVNF